MKLKDYIPNIDKKLFNTSFSGISFDSSKVKKDHIFFAIKGNKFNGNDFINTAIKKGAKIIVSEKKIKKEDAIYLHCPNVRKLLSEVSYKIFNYIPKNLIAVTGTNGKSSVSDFYLQILNLNSKKVASIGTIGIRTNYKNKMISNTTLDPIELGKTLVNLKKKKIDNVILEASSHGLSQNRLDGLIFNIGVFTNLSHDHLDYHKNMNDYLNSKLYLFEKLIKETGSIVTDANIPEIQKIKKISRKKKINLNLILDKNKGIQLISHKFENERQILSIRFRAKKYDFKLNLIGRLQIKNLLMAIVCAAKNGIKLINIIKILHKIKPVEGRLEKIGSIKNNSRVILDYAHTPIALETTLKNLKEQFPSSKISLVFGCGGDRDFKKRFAMGKIAEKYSNKIYLTDDNPRNENPSKIRKEIKRGIKKTKIFEITKRNKAIYRAINELNSGDLLLVAGKGHEKTQDYGTKNLFFSDQEEILKSIKIKNKFLSDDIKLNIINEVSKSKLKNLKVRNITINSKSVKKNDIFFAIKGKRNDGNKFISEAFKRKSSLAIVNQINKNHPLSKQIKVKDTLNFLTKCSSVYRDSLDTKIISITGSCGKTTLKEMIGLTLKKISKTTFSPNSFNNKYGVPLSLLNLKSKDEFGIIEVGMDKKGEINELSKVIKPDAAVITNISYAHSKNFKNIKDIADAKAEIMNNIKKGGSIILNMDDKFYNYHKNIALNKKLKVVSFSINKKTAIVKLTKIKKVKNNFELGVRIRNKFVSFFTKNANKSNIYNILATLASMNLYINVQNLKKNIFLNLKAPNGRGDISKISLGKKSFFLVDESYNSNPLSLRIALENYDKIRLKNSKKYLVLGDMLELGKHSFKQHKLMSNIINKTKIDQVYVVGKHVIDTFKYLKPNKKAEILTNKFDIIKLIKKNLNNNDYLMIKGSNSTGLHKITNDLKQKGLNAV